MKYKISAASAIVLLMVLASVVYASGLSNRLVGKRVPDQLVRVKLLGSVTVPEGRILKMTRRREGTENRIDLATTYGPGTHLNLLWTDPYPYATRRGKYYYQAALVNPDNNRWGQRSNNFKVITLTRAGENLHKPYNLKYQVYENSDGVCKVKLNWKVRDTEDLTGFQVRRRTIPNGTWGEFTTTPAEQQRHIFDAVSASSDYRYNIRSVVNGTVNTNSSNGVTVPNSKIDDCLSN